MAGEKGLEECTWDSAVCAYFRFGSTKVELTKFTPPKVEVKVEKVPRIGEMLATKRTPGRAEISQISCEMLLTDWEKTVLPRMPVHGGTMTGFVITASVFHPSVKGSYGILCDGCRTLVWDGPEMDGSEKGLIKKFSIDPMAVWEKGRDGKWKCLVLGALPSSQAIPLLQF